MITDKDVRESTPFDLAQKIIAGMKGYRKTALDRATDTDALMQALHAIIVTSRNQERELASATFRQNVEQNGEDVEEMLPNALRRLWTAQDERRLIAVLGIVVHHLSFEDGHFVLFNSKAGYYLKAETLVGLIEAAERKASADKARRRREDEASVRHEQSSNE